MDDRVIVPDGSNNLNPARVIHRCPLCKREGTFDSVSVPDVTVAGSLNEEEFRHGTKLAGIRRCPNPQCRALVFAVFPNGGGIPDVAYPVSHVDFDTTDIPVGIRDCMNEVLTCHANKSYVAAAIMVRRTLELICANKNAVGDNLKARIKNLGGRIVLPQELFDAMDELRLLGNDAAHVEAQEFADVDKPHLDVAIEFCKEILKATYQYAALLAKLQALKKSP